MHVIQLHIAIASYSWFLFNASAWYEITAPVYSYALAGSQFFFMFWVDRRTNDLQSALANCS